MARVLTISAGKCTGCRMCELACSSIKEAQFIPHRSRIQVIDNRLEGWSRPTVCLQCEEPMCMAVCPAEAISMSETAQGDHVVMVDAEKCTSCHSCLAACPFGAMNVLPKQKAVKCDLCDGSPECVKFCFYDCLHFVELSEQERASRARELKALTVRTCREIGRQEIIRRQVAASLHVSELTPQH